MRQQVLRTAAILVVALALVKLGSIAVAGQTQPTAAKTTTATKTDFTSKTAWGEPDLQGIWTYEYQIPLQRPVEFAGKESFTDAEIAQLDKQRATLKRRDARAARGSEADVSGAYNSVFNNFYHTGRRTSLIVDPPDGRIPSFTPAVVERMKKDREFQLALIQATEVCKKQEAGCAGWKYGPPSPKRAEAPPSYVTGAVNRADGPEDRNAAERCLMGGLPDFGSPHNVFGGNYRRIVQSPGQVSLFLDYGQGQGFHRAIPVTTNPHLPSNIRQWWGDSRAHWEGHTLVVDVTNFTAKADYQGSRENLHLIERWTRTGPNTLDYVVTMDDRTTWTKPWTVKQELVKQPDEPNRIYSEPRCHEGNYALGAILAGARTADKAFAEGRGPDPATTCGGTGCGGGGGGEETRDPIQ